MVSLHPSRSLLTTVYSISSRFLNQDRTEQFCRVAFLCAWAEHSDRLLKLTVPMDDLSMTVGIARNYSLLTG